MNILIIDELINGTITNQFEIEIENETISTQELIEKRVIQEVNNYNNKLPEYFNGLVEPTEAEKNLNGFKLKKRQLIDHEKQVYVALDAFQKNAFFILVDNIQIEEINQEIKLKDHSKVSFIKLTPLIGG
ncbi:MAG: hypothetical protein IPH93_07215 [Saprospiraceae bacterium]|nr:hypothetical protein [Saprospiraceae bacterium]MBK9631226.1 hypothetical protein [Saprospiraceae bacterium]